jgi:hypothetical protein
MPYALIPDGYTLKKVTELQHRAVKDHRRHEDVKTFLDNETTPLLIGGTMAIALTPVLWKLFLDKIKEGVGLDLSDITTLLEKLRGERPPKESTTPPVGGYGR